MQRTSVAVFLLTALTIATICGNVPAASVDDFDEFSNDGLPGQIYVPPVAETSATPRPLIVFLHGAGETGTDNRSQINGNIDNLLSAAKAHSAFLYAPQATTVVGGIYNWNSTSRTDDVLAMVDRALTEYNVDPNRFYVTGLSMGGGGTWNLASRFADKFAAAIPIAGVLPDADFAPAKILETPTWAFHARNDNVITKDRSRDRLNEVLVADDQSEIDSFPADSDTSTTFHSEYIDGVADVRYTEYPSGGHGIWGRVYNTPAVYDWMFAQSVSGDRFTGDLNGDRSLNLTDLDLLVSAIVANNNETQFDFNGDGEVSIADRDYWLTEYKESLAGDADLDSFVGAADLNAVGLNWQSDSATSWADGDFNGDGFVNASDLNDIGRNWRRSGIVQIAPAMPVPEPGILPLTVFGIVGTWGLSRRLALHD